MKIIIKEEMQNDLKKLYKTILYFILAILWIPFTVIVSYFSHKLNFIVSPSDYNSSQNINLIDYLLSINNLKDLCKPLFIGLITEGFIAFIFIIGFLLIYLGRLILITIGNYFKRNIEIQKD